MAQVIQLIHSTQIYNWIGGEPQLVLETPMEPAILAIPLEDPSQRQILGFEEEAAG
jgi:hypothetical protein